MKMWMYVPHSHNVKHLLNRSHIDQRPVSKHTIVHRLVDSQQQMPIVVGEDRYRPTRYNQTFPHDSDRVYLTFSAGVSKPDLPLHLPGTRGFKAKTTNEI